MAAIYDLKAWLDQGNAPETTEDAADLEQALLGVSQGTYRCEAKQSGNYLLVTGPGKEAFLFQKATRDEHLSRLKSMYQSEPGASLQGDSALERVMSKDD